MNVFYSHSSEGDDEFVFDIKSVPKGKNLKTYKEFIMFPKSNNHCSKVDTKKGTWYYCATCERQVSVRTGREFTLARFKDHEEQDVTHREKVRHQNELKLLKLKKADRSKLTSLELCTLKQNVKTQCPMSQYFSAATSKKELSKSRGKDKNSTMAAPPLTIAVDETAREDDVIVNETAREDDVLSWVSKKPATCEGVMPDFRKRDFKASLHAYGLYVAIDMSALYKFGFVSERQYSQIFSNSCTKSKGTARKTQFGTIYSCDLCNKLRYVLTISCSHKSN